MRHPRAGEQEGLLRQWCVICFGVVGWFCVQFIVFSCCKVETADFSVGQTACVALIKSVDMQTFHVSFPFHILCFFAFIDVLTVVASRRILRVLCGAHPSSL